MLFACRSDLEAEESATVDTKAYAPSKYPILGWKDRNLEDEYLDDLAKQNKKLIILGLVARCVLRLPPLSLGPLC